jgi:hypothetical protein
MMSCDNNHFGESRTTGPSGLATKTERYDRPQTSASLDDNQTRRRPESRIAWLARGAGRTALVTLVSVAVLAADPAAPDSSGDIQPVTPVVTHIRKINQDRKGVLMTNSPYGYYRGRVFATDSVTELFATGGKDNTFDMISQDRGERHITQCGWIESAMLRRGRIQPVASSPCQRDPRAFLDRNSFGKGFNCPPSKCVDGTHSTYLTPQCDGKVYYNLAPKRQSPIRSAASAKFSDFYDYAGKVNSLEPVHYRYTTLDDQAAVVRTKDYGWVFIHKVCIAGYPQGGTPKRAPLALSALLKDTGFLVRESGFLVRKAILWAVRWSSSVVGTLGSTIVQMTAAL